MWLILLLLACSEPEDSCDWTWIDEEACLMDVCEAQQASDDECWCYEAESCWFSGEVLR
jgi:hypothetical protein